MFLAHRTGRVAGVWVGIGIDWSLLLQCENEAKGCSLSERPSSTLSVFFEK